MQVGILIRDGSIVKAKYAYAGDISVDIMNAEVARLEAKYPSYIVEKFDSDQDLGFVNAEVTDPIPAE